MKRDGDAVQVPVVWSESPEAPEESVQHMCVINQICDSKGP